MSKSNWDRNVALTLASIAVLSVVASGTAYWVSALYSDLQESNSRYQQQAASDQRKASEKTQKACEGKQGIALTDCIAEEFDTYYEYRSANEDLQAQKEMALWAGLMFGASAATVVLTAFGVWLLWLTLSATRQTLAEAEKTTRAAQETLEVTKDQGALQLQSVIRIVGIAPSIYTRPRESGSFLVRRGRSRMASPFVNNYLMFTVALANAGRIAAMEVAVSARITLLFEDARYEYDPESKAFAYIFPSSNPMENPTLCHLSATDALAQLRQRHPRAHPSDIRVRGFVSITYSDGLLRAGDDRRECRWSFRGSISGEQFVRAETQ